MWPFAALVYRSWAVGRSRSGHRMKAVAAERTRQTIAEVAWGLFVGDGTQATTVRAIDTSKRGEGLWTT